MPETIVPHPVTVEPQVVPLTDLPPLVTTHEAAAAAVGTPPTVEKGPGWATVTLIGVAGLLFGLAAGLATGLAIGDSRIETLEAQIAAATVADADVSLAMEHLAQVPGGWTTDDYSLAREHLAQAPGGWTTDSYSLAREHLAQAPTTR